MSAIHGHAETAGLATVETEKRRREMKCAHGKELVGADPKCDHDIRAQWSGVKCVKCGGVYCL